MNERIEKLLEHVRVNEQIERLAKQAGCSIDRLGFGEGHLEKFAELIVQECVSICYIVRDNPDLPFSSAGAGDCVKEILEHFGVE